MFKYVLRNAVSATLTVIGLYVGWLLGGTVLVETMFDWPGIGLYVDQSIPAADFPAIAGVTLVLGVGYVVINTFVDIAQAIADPRVTLA